MTDCVSTLDGRQAAAASRGEGLAQDGWGVVSATDSTREVESLGIRASSSCRLDWVKNNTVVVGVSCATNEWLRKQLAKGRGDAVAAGPRFAMVLGLGDSGSPPCSICFRGDGPR